MTAILLRAAGLGFATGIRSVTPLAVVARAAASRRPAAPTHSLLALLGRRDLSTLITLAAIGEVIGDKIPDIPRRTSTIPLLWRIALAATAGTALCADENQPRLPGALIGAAFAVLGAHAGYGVRMWLTRRKVPNIIAGTAGDAVALSLARVGLGRGQTVER
jgi:uncharacterized membrane protein